MNIKERLEKFKDRCYLTASATDVLIPLLADAYEALQVYETSDKRDPKMPDFAKIAARTIDKINKAIKEPKDDGTYEARWL